MEIIINTGLKGKKNLGICLSIEGQLSDGMWENSSRMEKYWRNTDFRLNENDEVLLILTSNIFYHGFKKHYACYTEKEILNWFATRIKDLLKAESEDQKTNIAKNSTNKTIYIRKYDKTIEDILVKDCWEAYNILRGRN